MNDLDDQFKLLLEMSDENFNPFERQYTLRKASRAVILNDKGEVALMFVSKKGYYKLPGGGAEYGESLEDTLYREITEETGCKISIEAKLGITIEYVNFPDKDNGMLQISYAYKCKLLEITNKTSLTEKEKENGFELKWVKIEDAVKLMEETDVEEYRPYFIVKRDLSILKAL